MTLWLIYANVVVWSALVALHLLLRERDKR